MTHNLEYYLDQFNTLTPTDTQVGSLVTQTDWWTPLKNQFDDLIWLYYPERTLFLNSRFNPENEASTYANILKSFAIWIKSKKTLLDMLWEVYIATFNPTWNVDAVIGTVSQDDHTGTDVSAKTGSDTSRQSGSDALQLSGSDVVAQSGSDISQASGTDSAEDHVTKDETTRTGSQSVAGSGTDINSHAKFTFDDQETAKKEGIDSTEYGKTDTTTYNNVKDAHVSDTESETTYGRRDQMTYGKTDTSTYGRRDTTTYGKQDQMTYASTLTDTRNLSDKHIEMIIRQGNIGTTRTDEILSHSLDLYHNDNMDFYKYVVRMCVNQVTYAVEGVI